MPISTFATSLSNIMCDTVFGPAYLGPVSVISSGAAWENGWSRIRDDWLDEEVMQKRVVSNCTPREDAAEMFTPQTDHSLLVTKLELRRQFTIQNLIVLWDSQHDPHFRPLKQSKMWNAYSTTMSLPERERLAHYSRCLGIRLPLI